MKLIHIQINIFFGENIFVSPISQPINNSTGLAENWPL